MSANHNLTFHRSGFMLLLGWTTRASPWEAWHPLVQRCPISRNQTPPDRPLLCPSLNKPQWPTSFGTPQKPLILERALGTPCWYFRLAPSPGGGCAWWVPLPVCQVPASPLHPRSLWGTGQRGFS